MGWLIFVSVLGFVFGLLWSRWMSGLDAEDRRTAGYWALPVMFFFVLFGGVYFESALVAAGYGMGAGAATWWIWWVVRWLIRYREGRHN